MHKRKNQLKALSFALMVSGGEVGGGLDETGDGD